MKHVLKDQFAWYSTRFAENLGMPGLAALALALIILLYVPFAIWPAQEQLNQLNSAKPSMASKQKAAAVSPENAFFEQFPSVNQLSLELQSIFDIAQNNGLGLEEVTYKKSQQPNARIVNYHVDFMLKASYPATRAFLTDTLAALHYVSLDQFTVTRPNLQSNEVQSNIRLTIHMLQP